MKLECCRYQKKRRDHGFSVLAQFLRPADGLGTRNKGKYSSAKKISETTSPASSESPPSREDRRNYGSWIMGRHLGGINQFSVLSIPRFWAIGDGGSQGGSTCDRSSRSVWRLVLLRRSFAAIFRLCWPSRLTRQPSLIRRLSSFTTPGDTRTPFPSRSGYWLYAKRRSVATIPSSQRR